MIVFRDLVGQYTVGNSLGQFQYMWIYMWIYIFVHIFFFGGSKNPKPKPKKLEIPWGFFFGGGGGVKRDLFIGTMFGVLLLNHY